jgi:hypothetical protein
LSTSLHPVGNRNDARNLAPMMAPSSEIAPRSGYPDEAVGCEQNDAANVAQAKTPKAARVRIRVGNDGFMRGDENID